MNANQKRRADRLAAISGYLKFTGGRFTSREIHGEMQALNISFSTLQEYLRDLIKQKEIHSIVESRAGINGALQVHYAYGPSADGRQSLSKPRHKDISAQCNWLKANEWPRGQHGRDPYALPAGMFGEVRA